MTSPCLPVVLLAMFASTPSAVAAPPTAPAAPVRFPALVTSDLTGAERRLPDGVPGDLKLFVVAYQQRQQRDVDPWITLGLRLERAHPGFRVYELPTLSWRWAVARGWIDGGMRRGIPDVAARARTLTLYLDKDAFNRALGLPREDQIYALLVDRDGVVVARWAGRPDAAAATALAAALTGRGAAAR